MSPEDIMALILIACAVIPVVVFVLAMRSGKYDIPQGSIFDDVIDALKENTRALDSHKCDCNKEREE